METTKKKIIRSSKNETKSITCCCIKLNPAVRSGLCISTRAQQCYGCTEERNSIEQKQPLGGVTKKAGVLHCCGRCADCSDVRKASPDKSAAGASHEAGRCARSKQKFFVEQQAANFNTSCTTRPERWAASWGVRCSRLTHPQSGDILKALL